MLQLSNIQFQSNAKFLNKQMRKYIRFSYKKTIINSKNFCAIVNQSTIKWTEVMKLPQVYNQPIDFQIYDSHEFGYNPQALESVLYGQIKIIEGQNIIKSKVFNNQQQNIKVGTLVINIGKQQKQITANKAELKYEKQQKIQPEAHLNINQPIISQQVHVITSILIRNLQKPPLKGYITVTLQNSKKTLKSQMIQPLKGQFMFFMKSKTNDYLIKLKQLNETLTIQFHSENGKIQGRAHYVFKPNKRINRIDLINQENVKNGQLYIEVQKKSLDVKKVSKIKKSKFGVERQENEETRKKTTSTLSLYKLRSLSQSQLNRMGESQFLGTSRQKRMSVFHHNNDIVFPSQRRFQLYQDKQTNIISYSDLPSMKFEQQHSKKFYKGASIGKGQKEDFTRYYKQNPGVGQYKLPSIFDRY